MVSKLPTLLVVVNDRFKRHGGADHFIVSLWWGTTKALGEKLVSLLAHKATIIAYDEYFASDWTKVDGTFTEGGELKEDEEETPRRILILCFTLV